MDSMAGAVLTVSSSEGCRELGYLKIELDVRLYDIVNLQTKYKVSLRNTANFTLPLISSTAMIGKAYGSPGASVNPLLSR